MAQRIEAWRRWSPEPAQGAEHLKEKKEEEYQL